MFSDHLNLTKLIQGAHFFVNFTKQMCMCYTNQQKIKQQTCRPSRKYRPICRLCKLIIRLLLKENWFGFWEMKTCRNGNSYLIGDSAVLIPFIRVSYHTRFKWLTFKCTQTVKHVWCSILVDITLAKLWFLRDARRSNNNAVIWFALI